MTIQEQAKTSRIQWHDVPSVTPAQIEAVASRFKASLTSQELFSFNGRIERGVELAKQAGSVCKLDEPFHARRYTVRASDGFHAYLVDLDAGTCDCPDALKGHFCKHRLASLFIEQASKTSAPKKSTEQILAELGF